MKNLLIVTVIAAGMAAPVVRAQTPAPAPAKKESTIKERKEAQQQRIAKGVASGQLTPKETVKLEKAEAKVNREVRHDRKTGGKLTPKERRKINRDQNKVSQQIAKQKHDKQKQ